MTPIDFSSLFRVVLAVLNAAGVTFVAVLPFAVAGTLLGVLVAWLLHASFRRFNIYASNSPRSVWFQRASFIFLAVAISFLFAIMAAAHRGCDLACDNIRQGALRTDMLSRVGSYCADGVFCLGQYLQNYEFANHQLNAEIFNLSDDQKAAGQKFQTGEIECNVTHLFKHLNQLNADTAAKFSPAVKSRLRQMLSLPPGSFGEMLADFFTDTFISAAFNSTLLHEVDPELAGAFENCIKTLPNAAHLSGDPDSISHSELSNHVVQNGLVALLEIPTRRFYFRIQFMLGLCVLTAALIPVVCFRMAHGFFAKKAIPAAQAEHVA